MRKGSRADALPASRRTGECWIELGWLPASVGAVSLAPNDRQTLTRTVRAGRRRLSGVRCALTVLGGFGAVVDGVTVPAAVWRHGRALQLVKILALSPGQRGPAEQVVDLLWPDLSAHAGGANLRKAAHFARRALGVPDAVVLAEGRVALFAQAEVWTDAEEFERSADAALRTGDLDVLAEAIRLYAGDLLPDDRYQDWAAGPRERLRRKYLEALRRSGSWERLVDEEPFDEEAHRALIRMWLDRGNRHAALLRFARLQDLLVKELGVRPSRETLDLLSEIKAAAPQVPVACPLVGRDSELELALSRWTQARAGRGGAVLVSGEAGIGKTRFCDELVRIAQADGAVVIRESAHQEESSAPFGVIFGALGDILAARPELTDLLGREVRQRFAGSTPVNESGLSWLEAATPGIERQRLFSSVAQVVTMAARDSGLLLLVEDLHNADDGSLQLLSYLCETAPAKRLLLVASHRSEAMTPALSVLRSRLLEQQRTADIRLERIDRDAVALLVAHASGGSATQVAVDEVWNLAEGNPFYSEELAASIASGGAVQVPERVYEVIWARLDRLDTAVRHTLRQLAVIGDRFTAGEFTAVIEADEATAFAYLDQAVRMGVIDEQASCYQFRHALTRRALERSLPRHRRRQIHSETAARLAKTSTSPARVAYHLLQAGEEEAAVYWLEQAAMQAATLGAYSDGLRLATDAVTRASRSDRARLLALRADMLYATGDPAAGSAYDAALATAAPEVRPRLWVMKARVLLATGMIDEARQAVEWAEPTQNEDRIAKLVVTGLVEWACGDVDAAERAAREARATAVAAGHLPGLGEATELLGLVAHSRGQWRDRVRSELTDTLKRPEEVAGSVFDAHLCLAEYLLYGQQPYDQVIDFAADLRATAARAGASRGEAFATCVLGEAELLSGRLTDAQDHLNRAAVLHEAVGAVAGQALALQRLGEAALAAGDTARANDLLDEAERVSQGSILERHLLGKIYGTRVRAAQDAVLAMSAVERAEARMSDHPVCQPCSIGFYVAASIAASRVSDIALAKKYLIKAETVSARWSGGGWHAAVLECRAELAAAEGRPDDAGRLFNQAASSFDRAGQPLDAERCRLTGR